jgi:integrase
VGQVSAARALARRAAGTGSVAYDAAAGEWIGRLPGAMRQIVARGDDKADVERRLAEACLALERRPDDARQPLASWVLQVLSEREAAGYRDGAAVYRARAHVLDDPLGRLPVALVDEADVRQWLLRMQCKRGAHGLPLAARTIRNALVLLRGALEEARRAGLVEGNAADGLHVPEIRGRTTERRVVLSPVECAKIVCNEALSAELREMVALSLATGMRLGELLALRTVEVSRDPEARLLTIRYGGPPSKPTKSGRPRTLTLAPGVWESLVMWLAVLESSGRANPHGLVFPGKAGGFQWGPPGEWRLARERAGCPEGTRWHDLRHTAATGALFGWWGPPQAPREVQRMLGHADLTTTEGYLHDLDERVRSYCVKKS